MWLLKMGLMNANNTLLYKYWYIYQKYRNNYNIVFCTYTIYLFSQS